MASRPSPDWGPDDDPWAIYTKWMSQFSDPTSVWYHCPICNEEGPKICSCDTREGRVQVDGNCFACMHGACPEELSCTPVKARMYAVVKYFYVHYRIPLCTVCSELYDWDPSFTMWVRNTYIEERQKGAA